MSIPFDWVDQMPPKKSNLNNASSKRSRRKRVERAQQLPEQIETRNAAQRIRTAESRAQESQEQRDERLQQNITRTRVARERNIATVRVLDRQRQRISRSLTRASFVRLAFEYAPDINYSAHSKIAIGGMDKVCQYCQALKFRNEAAGMCCASGKVVLSPLPAPPEALLSLLTGNSDDSKLFLPDKVPLGEHAGRFNAPTVDEVAVIMVGDPVDKRSIKITRRDNTVSTISDLHRSYDALQYPLIFCQRQDEYHLNIKQYDPNTGNIKTIISFDIESLRFLRFNQAKLRSEEYIHLRDAVAGNIDGNLNPNDIGNAFILPSSYIGSPRNMQEYIQDAMTYVRHYGRPDLVITFTCNPNWEEIQTLLLPGQQAIHRHDLTARSDLAKCEVQNINKNDEIARYQMGRYISSNEAIWHILSFPIHERDPAVQHLAIHLENGQRVYFTEENVLQRAFEAPKTTLTEFFTLCQKPDVVGQFAKTLVFGDVPRYFTWNKSNKKWEPRKQGKPHPSITGIFKAKTLGILYTVHPKQRECFYLHLLLVNVPGPTSFEFLRTVNGRVFNTYQDACRELQLLEDDNHWDLTLADAALTSTPNNIRQLFAIILTTCYPSQAQTLWEKYKNCMTEDILHRIRQTNQCQNIDYTPEMYNEALVLIEDLCVLISNLPLNHYGMPSPNRPATDLVNTDLQRENQYDHGSLATIIMNSEPLLTAEQKIIYDRIVLAVAAEQGGFFFLDAPGGTDKTFLISLILAKIRSQKKSH
ncbi:uncharacterized protein [Diabrotica undecimpunctata]|uniref:uncharacterized protein n=1 Tax=Diabrotica undecimpunctata TaxID=50387 RepID=UPI003B63C5AC